MSTVRQEMTGDVLHIELNRPDKRNALDDEMFDALVAAAEAPCNCSPSTVAISN
jgi:enoyl-CoA hydratase/carnithine racemase